jgi:hypothetical protein
MQSAYNAEYQVHTLKTGKFLNNKIRTKKMNKQQLITGDFGEMFFDFKGKPKDAILHLKKVKRGECIDALYRKEVGYIDIVWGKNDPKTNKGFGLKHIIEKHEKEINQLGFKIEDFIPIVVQFGDFNAKKSDTQKKVFESEMFRFVIAVQKKHGREKHWLLTSFDLRKKPKIK